MIIGIDGYAGAGKDTVANILVKEGFVSIAFADSLREAVCYSTRFNLNTFIDRGIKDKNFKEPYLISSVDLNKFCSHVGYGHKSQEVVDKYSGTKLESPRRILQFLGTEVGRDMLDDALWIKAWKRKIQGHKHVVAPDARMVNEREAIASMKGLNMFVSRKSVKPTENHKSGQDKWSLDKYDLVVHNDYDLFELKRGIRMWWSMKGFYSKWNNKEY